ncbi:MAG: phosphoribosylaminoimidazolesuccinocarboxamide synthase [Gammaproteobacteria bacterium]|nr:MAG: phosphoribosylaminoimidazolesuccinocarboxamide synthase [Gammaproteobacteria bacterium]
MTTAITETHLSHLPLLHRGKVRDIYEIDDRHLLIVATDRVSAFDVILPTAIPGKGAILADIANFWFQRTQHIIQNHCSTMELREVLSDAADYERLKHHAVIVKKMHNLPVEAIVRGYISGSAWKSYQHHGEICGIALPAGLQQAQQLPQPIFTPSSKAAVGEHDENIAFEVVIEKLGRALAEQIRQVSLQLYQTAAAYAKTRGIIIADTKFEFGTDAAGDLVLIDEALTPDSSRFWSAEDYRVGISPPSYDKQIIRDYLDTLDWDKTAPGPQLPQAIVDKALAKYTEVRDKLLLTR